jgi:hypothetical protein
MKLYFIFFIIATQASISNAQTAPNNEVRNPKTKAGFAISQFTYGAAERCKLASPESSQAYQTQKERLKTDYPKLVQLVVESSNYSWYKDELDNVRKSLPQNTQSATGDCGTFTFMLKASLDDPQGRKTLDGFVDILSK